MTETPTGLTLRLMRNEIIEQCAKAVEEIPSSASLYESSSTAYAVSKFKRHAAAEIRSLAVVSSPPTPESGNG